MDIEQVWYEFSPYVYSVAGALALFNAHSGVAVFSGVLLMTAALTILRLRWVHRRRQDKKVKPALPESR